MMHTRGTRRMFLKMEQHQSLEKLSVMPVQRNYCMGYLVRWWIHPLRCALDCLRTVSLCKAWMGCPQVDGSIQAGCLSIQGMNVLSSKRHGFIKARTTAPFVSNRRSSPSTSSILWHLFDPTLVLEKCFLGSYFIMCWYTLIVTLTYLENCLYYRIGNFIVSSLLSYM